MSLAKRRGFFLSFFPSLFQVCSMQSSLYGKSLPWQTSLQRNSKVSERFLWFPCAKLQSRVEIIASTSRGHSFLVLALIVTILYSTNIYSKRAFQQWVDCTNPMVGLRVMTILILLSLKNPKIIVHLWNVSCVTGCVGPMMWTPKGILVSFFPCFLTPLPSLVCFQSSLID